MTLPPERVHQIADQLFGAFVGHDYAAARALLADDCRAWGNALGGERDADAFIGVLPVLRQTIGDHRYAEVRRMVTGDGFVEQHRVLATTPGGEDLDLGEACVVVRLDEHGLVQRLDEYVDTAHAQNVLRRLAERPSS